jgi:hypothetical protein
MTRTAISRSDARREKAMAIVKAIRRPNEIAVETGLQPTHIPLRPGQIADGVVYFAFCAGRIKIGFTSNLADRMCSLSTSSPFPVTLLLTIPGSVADEQMYHRMFAEERVNLEWFDLSYRLDDFLQNRFESGTFELMTEAQFECHEFFLRQADMIKDIMSIVP